MLFKYQLIYTASFFGIFLSVFFFLTLLENLNKIKNPKLKGKPFVSVIVPAYNEEKNIRKTIDSLLHLDYPHFEIIVIDDGSTDSTLRIAKEMAKLDKKIKVYTKKNGGKASAINFALKRTKAKFVATLDADSFVTPSALKKMIGYFGDPTVASVTPSLKVYEPKGWLPRIQQIEYLFGVFYRKIFAFLNVLHVTPGPFSLYRKEFFDKHGMFDEDNPTEDTEIALRIQSNHYKIENSIDSVVYTVSPRKFVELLNQRKRWYYGLITNLENYMHLFTPQYGYLALLALPAALLSVVLIFMLVGYFFYITIDKAIQAFINYGLVGFDFITLLKGFKLEYLYYGYVGPLTFFLVALVLINILFVYLAKKHSGGKEKLKLSYFYYFGSYAYLYAFWWLVAIISRFFGVKWKGRDY
ncbi:glycosyltransferase [Nanoarchaeota archaeon]